MHVDKARREPDEQTPGRRVLVATSLAILMTLLSSCDAFQDNDTGFRGDNEFLSSRDITRMGQLNSSLRAALSAQALEGGLEYYRLPDSDEFDRIPQDPLNPLTRAKVRLGQLLYHETALGTSCRQESAAKTYSCAACHFAQAGFQAATPQGIAEGGRGFFARKLDPAYDSSTDENTPDLQPIRSPSSMNTAYQELMLWNGQFGGVGLNFGTEANWTGPKEANMLGMHGLETQAVAGMTVHRMNDVENSRVASIPFYQQLFVEAFPADAEPVNLMNTALAIAAFERTILSNRSPFQRWLRGETRAMSEDQMRGALLFFGKAECSACHTGPALSSMTFYALGMNDLDGAIDPRVDLRAFGGTVPDDVRRGRGGFTGRTSDDYRFKTPQLYNLADTPFYSHGASFSSIRDVIVYKNAAVPQNSLVPVERLSSYFRPLGLSESEIDDLEAFVKEALYDPELMRYVPAVLPSGNCTPHNDEQSRQELGCF
jgi:cytochrome c peroxidase